MLATQFHLTSTHKVSEHGPTCRSFYPIFSKTLQKLPLTFELLSCFEWFDASWSLWDNGAPDWHVVIVIIFSTIFLYITMPWIAKFMEPFPIWKEAPLMWHLHKIPPGYRRLSPSVGIHAQPHPLQTKQY